MPPYRIFQDQQFYKSQSINVFLFEKLNVKNTDIYARFSKERLQKETVYPRERHIVSLAWIVFIISILNFFTFCLNVFFYSLAMY